MENSRNYLLVAFLGCSIAVMVVANTILGQRATMALSFIINQVIGIILATLVLPFLRPKKRRESIAWYWYFGGVYGFFIIHANFITVTHIGAAFSMATAVFGQTIGSLLFDLTGFMGMKKHPITKNKAVTLVISLIGIIIMSLQGGSFSIPYILIGIGSGALTMIQMVYNSRFAEKKGILFSARHTVITGLLFALVAYSVMGFKATVGPISVIRDIPILLVVTGGILSIVIVSGANYVVSKVPALYYALLLSSTQILVSVFLDYYFFDLFSITLLIGALVILVGMGIGTFMGQRN
ncbi:MAG: DMT family transporter [Sphaerochaetaceae bacterium]|jgi:transporter family-2 protein